MPRESWTTIGADIVTPILSSGCTYQLPSVQWPPWARPPAFQRFFAYAVAPEESVPSVQTTGTVVGRLLSERYDAKDEKPYNYNWYWLAQNQDGNYYLSGPHKDVDFGHHLQEPVSDTTLSGRR